MSEYGNGSGGNMTGFVVGALVGAGLALIYAPCSGKDTRKWLAGKAKDLKSKTEDVYEDTKKTLQREAKNLVGEAKEVAAAHGISSYTGSGSKART